MRYVGIICSLLSILLLVSRVAAQSPPVSADTQYLPIRLIILKFIDAADVAFLFGGVVIQGGGMYGDGYAGGNSQRGYGDSSGGNGYGGSRSNGRGGGSNRSF